MVVLMAFLGVNPPKVEHLQGKHHLSPPKDKKFRVVSSGNELEEPTQFKVFKIKTCLEVLEIALSNFLGHRENV
jgi:hypothetical protein